MAETVSIKTSRMLTINKVTPSLLIAFQDEALLLLLLAVMSMQHVPVASHVLLPTHAHHDEVHRDMSDR
jgi:hypothetical protein